MHLYAHLIGSTLHPLVILKQLSNRLLGHHRWTDAKTKNVLHFTLTVKVVSINNRASLTEQLMLISNTQILIFSFKTKHKNKSQDGILNRVIYYTIVFVQ